MLTFYDKIPDMECIQGDTLPVFKISVDGNQVGGSMFLLIAPKNDPTRAAAEIKASATKNGFAVQITSRETSLLTEGTYLLVFCLVSDGLCYKKLAGFMRVSAAPVPMEV